jgi:alpha-glucosidase
MKSSYPPFESGLNNDIWIKNPDGSIYLGTVWPGITAFPDWHHPKAGGWWSEQFANFHRNISFDGILLDMNEASSFCVGSCGSPIGESKDWTCICFIDFNVFKCLGTDSTSVPSGVSSSRDINYPPYTINNVQDGHDLAAHTISPNATHVDGFQEYDVHNLWGYQETNATYNALIDIFNTKRPFIITRSTFAGSGKWAGHWGGDNFSSWLYMALSIPQALSFSLFGVPMFGVDTCGFIGDTTEELCNRWMQLSAFFPFYRNHNEGATSQEPYMWPSVTEASITAMKIRYALLPYFYTLLHLAHTTGSTVMRALAWEFPNDPSLAAADRQFLVGPSLMVIPVLNENATTVSGVFPGTDEIWYDWYNQSKVAAQPGTNVSLDAPLGHIPVFLRGGSVLPLQQPALVTRDVRNSPWSIIVALSNNGTASGSLYIDDGEIIQPNATTIVNFAVTQSSTLQANVIGSFKDKNPLANVTIMGVPSTLTHKVTFNGAKVGNSSITYNETTRVLVVNGLRNLTESNGAWGANWTLTW